MWTANRHYFIPHFESIRISEGERLEVIPVRLNDRNITGFVGCEHSVDIDSASVGELGNGTISVLDDVVVMIAPFLFIKKPVPKAIGRSLSPTMIDTTAPFAALAIVGMSFRGGDCAVTLLAVRAAHRPRIQIATVPPSILFTARSPTKISNVWLTFSVAGAFSS